jgi:hypothetical protein
MPAGDNTGTIPPPPGSLQRRIDHLLFIMEGLDSRPDGGARDWMQEAKPVIAERLHPKCPQCQCLAVTRMRRSGWEHFLAVFSDRMKWECGSCGWQWLARDGRGEEKYDEYAASD